MLIRPIEWNDTYNIGVEYVDSAHKKLFGIMNKITKLLRENDYEKNKHACVEAIKYLYNYTDKHFKEEEGYMKTIQYAGYEQHKKLHDNLRNNTIPVLEEELENADFSPEAIRRFVGIFAGWLTGHIMVEDVAISGRIQSRYENRGEEGKQALLVDAVEHTARDIFRTKADLFNAHYAGEELHRSLVCEIQYALTESENKTAIVDFVAEEKFICHVASILTGIENESLKKEALLAFLQLVQALGKSYLQVMEPETMPEVKQAKVLDEAALKAKIKQQIPEYSMAWKTPQGFFAICID